MQDALYNLLMQPVKPKPTAVVGAPLLGVTVDASQAAQPQGAFGPNSPLAGQGTDSRAAAADDSSSPGSSWTTWLMVIGVAGAAGYFLGHKDATALSKGESRYTSAKLRDARDWAAAKIAARKNVAGL